MDIFKWSQTLHKSVLTPLFIYFMMVEIRSLEDGQDVNRGMCKKSVKVFSWIVWIVGWYIPGIPMVTLSAELFVITKN